MTERWFTDEQVTKVAKDVYDDNAAQADAMDMQVDDWGKLSPERRQRWIDRARERLESMVPLDLSRPLRMRDGTPVSGAKLSDDGLCIIADVAAWGSCGSWPRNGSVEGDETDPFGLVYADELPKEPADAEAPPAA